MVGAAQAKAPDAEVLHVSWNAGGPQEDVSRLPSQNGGLRFPHVAAGSRCVACGCIDVASVVLSCSKEAKIGDSNNLGKMHCLGSLVQW
jgi:hypothetical protein